MSARWFRFYAEAMRNPKVAKLSDKQFRLWVQLLSVASENDGKIPAVDDLKVVLNRRLDHLLTGVKELLSAGLIDSLEYGYEPHNWSKWQSSLRPNASEWRALREVVFERDDYTCSYCGSRGGKLECDHIHPVSKGGNNDLTNLTTACWSCNRSKAGKTLSEWGTC